MRRSIFILSVALLSVSTGSSQTGDFYEISRLPFSSGQYDELAPAYFGQGLVFTSNRRMDVLISRLTDKGENLFNIFYAEKRETGRWRTPELLDKTLKSNYHDGPVSFSADGSRIFFTRNMPGRDNEASKLGIYMADYSDGKWINITPFPHNNENYNLTHPSISADGKTLYFASDMPGGYGGMDIYASVMQGRSWSAPSNLGETINSPRDEVFPYIHPGGRLYFSSNSGTGNALDIFFSTKRDNTWQIPVKLPEPFNSDADDFGFIADPELGSGFFTSNRVGSDDIYSFISTFPVFSECNAILEPELCYIFFEERAGVIDTTTLYFEWDMGDGSRYRGLEADHCFEDIGTYTVRLDVVDIITGELQSNVAYYNFTIPRIEQPYITAPDTVYVDQQVMLDASETYLLNFDIDEYYWDLGDGTKTVGEVIYHSFSVPGTYEVSLGILPDPDSIYGQQRYCSYKHIVVLETPGD